MLFPILLISQVLSLLESLHMPSHLLRNPLPNRSPGTLLGLEEQTLDIPSLAGPAYSLSSAHIRTHHTVCCPQECRPGVLRPQHRLDVAMGRCAHPSMLGHDRDVVCAALEMSNGDNASSTENSLRSDCTAQRTFVRQAGCHTCSPHTHSPLLSAQPSHPITPPSPAPTAYIPIFFPFPRQSCNRTAHPPTLSPQ